MTFEMLYETYMPLVQVVLRRLVHGISSDQVENLTQETFLKAWKAYDRVDPVNLKAWLVRIARNVAFDALRCERLHRRHVCPLNEERAALIPDEHYSASMVYSGEADLIARTLSQISQNERMVLVLVFQAYTGREIAALLHLDYNACRMRILRARRHFRRVYALERGV